jgi:1-acyl-sn-glycerol-3-phosphate acyltransferase
MNDLFLISKSITHAVCDIIKQNHHIFGNDIKKQLIKFMEINEKHFKNIKYNGLDKLPKNGGYIIISNHCSCFDHLIIKKICNCYTVALSLVEKTFISNNFFDKYKILFYDKTIKDHGNQIKNKILSLTNNNENVLVFPEGDFFLKNGNQIYPFKKGLFHLAYDNNIPVVPIFQRHHNFYNSFYTYSQIFNIIFDLPINDLDVDVTINDTIIPKNYQTFDEFYSNVVAIYEKHVLS